MSSDSIVMVKWMDWMKNNGLKEYMVQLASIIQRFIASSTRKGINGYLKCHEKEFTKKYNRIRNSNQKECTAFFYSRMTKQNIPNDVWRIRSDTCIVTAKKLLDKAIYNNRCDVKPILLDIPPAPGYMLLWDWIKDYNMVHFIPKIKWLMTFLKPKKDHEVTKITNVQFTQLLSTIANQYMKECLIFLYNHVMRAKRGKKCMHWYINKSTCPATARKLFERYVNNGDFIPVDQHLDLGEESATDNEIEDDYGADEEIIETPPPKLRRPFVVDPIYQNIQFDIYV